MTDSNNTPTNPASQEASSNGEPLRVVVIGSTSGVTRMIHTFSDIRFAQINEWSPLSPAPNRAQVMSILTRYIPKQ